MALNTNNTSLSLRGSLTISVTQNQMKTGKILHVLDDINPRLLTWDWSLVYIGDFRPSRPPYLCELPLANIGLWAGNVQRN